MKNKIKNTLAFLGLLQISHINIGLNTTHIRVLIPVLGIIIPSLLLWLVVSVPEAVGAREWHVYKWDNWVLSEWVTQIAEHRYGSHQRTWV